MQIVKRKQKLANDKHLSMLVEIDVMGENFDEWEIGFIQSLMELKNASPELSLTKPQMVKISNIHARRVM